MVLSKPSDFAQARSALRLSSFIILSVARAGAWIDGTSHGILAPPPLDASACTRNGSRPKAQRQLPGYGPDSVTGRGCATTLFMSLRPIGWVFVLFGLFWGAWAVAAVDLQRALSALGEIVGETTCEDVLERIFSQFCIGK